LPAIPRSISAGDYAAPRAASGSDVVVGTVQRTLERRRDPRERVLQGASPGREVVPAAGDHVGPQRKADCARFGDELRLCGQRARIVAARDDDALLAEAA